MSGEQPSLALFLDRSTQGKRFVEAVRSLVDDVVTINDRYGVKAAEGVPDTRWIAEASIEGRILIGADRNILRNQLERHAICGNAARCVVFSNNNMSMYQMIGPFERHLPHIRGLTATPGPWVQRVARHGMERLSLDCSDS